MRRPRELRRGTRSRCRRRVRLQGAPEALGDGVVAAVALAAHAANHAVLLERAAVATARALASTVEVMDQPGARPTALDGLDGHREGVQAEVAAVAARSPRKHRPLIPNWFAARRKGAFALGATEGPTPRLTDSRDDPKLGLVAAALGATEDLNNKAKLSSELGLGFRTEKHAKVALFGLGGPREPAWLAHRFTD